ncbi:MAG: hypothetical protein AB7P17_04340 [Nitrospirales bacterium]
MNLLPFTSPAWGLSICEDVLCFVEIKKGWRQPSFQQLKRIPLPSGMLKLSSAKPNILQTTEFIELLRQTGQTLSTPLPVALSLPDLCARTSIFEFSQFPHKSHDQRALLNWRFQQDLKLDISQSRLAYGAYVPLPRLETPAPPQPDRVQVLGAAIRNEIVEQFEHACLEADLLPISVGIAGLDIFDLYQGTLQEMLDTEYRRTPASFPGGLFIYLSHWGFTFLAFKDGSPQFIRTKAINIRKDSIREEAATQTILPSPPLSSSIYPPYTKVKVTKEILATIQYYLETFPLDAPKLSTMNLFISTDLDQSSSLLPSAEQLSSTLNVCDYPETTLQLIPLSSHNPMNPRSTLSLSDAEAGSALPGFARLRVA